MTVAVAVAMVAAMATQVAPLTVATAHREQNRMDNITKLREETQTAGRASQLLDNKEFKDAIKVVEAQYVDALLMADVKDDLARFRYSEAIKVIRLVTRQLSIAVQNGKLSQADLDAMSGKRKRFF